MHSIHPPLAHILTNYFHVPSALYMSASKVLWSHQGRTQGDTLSMVLCMPWEMMLLTDYFQGHNPNLS